MQELTYQNIVHNLGVKIQAIQNEIQRIRDTKGLGIDKLGRILSLEIDLQYNQMLKAACEKQIPKKPVEGNTFKHMGYCTGCGTIISTRSASKNCQYCGQAAEWEKVKEK